MTPPDTHGMPHSLLHERNMVAVVLNYPEVLDEFPELSPDHFHDRTCRAIFTHAKEAWNARAGADTLDHTTIAALAIQDAGEEAYSALVALLDGRPTLSHIEDNVTELRHQRARRMTVQLSRELDEAARDSQNVNELISLTSGPVSAIHDEITGTAPPRDTPALLRSILEKLQQRIESGKRKEGILTSLPAINNRFGGLHAGQMVVISGYPGGGKTILGGQFVMDAALSGSPSLFVSLEMDDESLMSRFVAYAGHLPGKALDDPVGWALEKHGTTKPVKADLMAINRAITRVNESPILIEEMNMPNVYQICAVIRRTHRKTPLGVAAVDYAQRIAAPPEMRNPTMEAVLSHAANYLAALARELRISLILLSQLNKEGAAKHAEAINEAADLHLQILQDRHGTAKEPATNAHIGLGIPKDRHHGMQGHTLDTIILDRAKVRFIELDTRDRESSSQCPASFHG